MKLNAVIIHDHEQMRTMLADYMRGWKKYDTLVEAAPYSSRLSGTMRRWIEETDIFVLGLERHYKEGRCTEGVQTAAMLWKFNKKAIIAGSEYTANKVGSPLYWDLASEISFLQAVESVLKSPLPGSSEIEKLVSYFSNRAAKPVGHGKE